MGKRTNKGSARAEPPDSESPGLKPAYDAWDWVPQAEREFDKLPDHVAGTFMDLMERVLGRQTRNGNVKTIGQGISELRTRFGNNHYRILYFVDGRVCVALTCFYKNQQKTAKQDIERALGRRAAYLRDK